jgi:2-iminobutanoate/2-iminopropanoate deaminase
MSRPIMPAVLAPPAAHYAHAMLSEGSGRWLHTSGVVPVNPDGSVPAGLVEQAEVVWRNLTAILADAQMSPSDVVSVTTYVVAAEMDGLSAVMAARDRALEGHRAASTLVTVPALARAEWSLEIALVAFAEHPV